MLGALLGTQNGREVEIVNTFELAVENNGESVDHSFLVSRRDQCTYLCQLPLQFRQLTAKILDKQVFPSLEFIGWYTIALRPTSKHISLHEQVCIGKL